MDSSTAPTTPDGSLTFSPVLQASHILDAFEGGLAPAFGSRRSRTFSASLDLDSTSIPVVKNICCVGAGYVGESVFLIVSSVSSSNQ